MIATSIAWADLWLRLRGGVIALAGLALILIFVFAFVVLVLAVVRAVGDRQLRESRIDH